jgi:hypothetical protein
MLLRAYEMTGMRAQPERGSPFKLQSNFGCIRFIVAQKLGKAKEFYDLASAFSSNISRGDKKSFYQCDLSDLEADFIALTQ